MSNNIVKYNNNIKLGTQKLVIRSKYQNYSSTKNHYCTRYYTDVNDMNTHALHRRRQYDSTSQSTVRSTRTFIFLSGAIQTTRLFIIISRRSSILSSRHSRLLRNSRSIPTPST